MTRPTLLFLVTEDWYFWSHRADLAQAAIGAGYRVVLATRFTAHRDRIADAGIECVALPFVRALRNPIGEFTLACRILALIAQEAPAVVHAVSLKPILLSLLSVYLRPSVRFCLALTGLGHLFIGTRWRTRVLRAGILRCLRLLGRRANCHFIVQNVDDLALLRDERIARDAAVSLVRGAGVDTSRFRPVPLPLESAPVVMLPARMLRDKGILEFISAARLLSDRGARVRCVLVGGIDTDNPAGLATSELREACARGGVEWWGQREDMPDVLARATIVCLPSYREGLPKALLEAAACARPLVATDVPGCREICRDGETGLLVPPREPLPLARAIERLIDDPERCARYGRAARALVEREFSAAIVNRQMLALYAALPGTR